MKIFNESHNIPRDVLGENIYEKFDEVNHPIISQACKYCNQNKK